MSAINVNSITGRTGTHGPVLTGVTTVTGGTLNTADLNVTGAASFSGNVSIAGTLSYEDVTDIDSVGIITAQAGIHVTGGNVGIGTDTSGSTKLKIESGSGARAISLNAPTNGTYITFETAGTAYADIGAEKGVVGSGSADTPVINARGSRDLAFRTNSSERLRITSGGLVGIQVTPTQQRLTIDVFNTGTTAASYDGINICNTSSTTNNGSAIAFGQAVSGNSYARIGVINSDRSSGSEDQDIFFGTLGGGSYAERMRITSDGNLNLGSATRFQTYKGIELYLTGDPTFAGCTANNNPGAYTTLAKFSGYSQSGSNFRENACIVMETDTVNNSGNAAGRILFRTEADNETNGVTSRMMLDCKGRMDIFASENNAIDIHTAYTGSTGALVVKSGATDLDSGNSTFILYADGDCENTNNSYGALSDQKLKENIVDASSQWNNIKDIRIRNFNFIEGQTHTQIGVVAQQVETVSPGLVKDIIDRDKDGNDLGTVTKSVKYSVLYMKSVKALQEAMARIETLEAKVAALEG